MASKYRRDGIWYVKWYVHGRRFRRSTYSPDERDADRLMAEVERQKLEIKQRGIGLPPKGKRYFSELLDDLDNDYKINNRRSCRDLYYRGEILRQSLGSMEVYPTASISTQTIISFRDALSKDGRSNGTINRYLAIISRAFRLARENEKVTVVPTIRRLKEAAPRTNWWSDDDIQLFLQACPRYLKDIVTFAGFVSWRRADILGLRREWVDGNIIRIPPGTTKGGEPRAYIIPQSLQHMFEGTGEFVFNRGDGKRIRSIRTAWDNAMLRANLKGRGLTFHALRRTARRLIERAGVSDRVGMAVMGHKTRWVYDNYRVVPQQDLEEAAARMDKAAPPWATVDNRKKKKVDD